MIRTISAEETRAIVECERGEAAPRQVAIEARRKRVALVVVKIERPAGWWRKIGKATGNGTDALGNLVRVNQIRVIAMENQWRADGGFLSLNDGSLNGEGQEDVGIANYVMVKEVPHTCVEVSDAGGPVSHRNRDAVLLLDVALTLQWQKSQPLALGEIKQRTGNRVERRRLIVVGISRPQHPIQLGDGDGHAQPRIDRVFGKVAGKVRHPESASKRQP